MSIQATSSMAPWSPVGAQPSPWHSPVPYLFGGLAAMLGLIAFALLLLACSCGWEASRDGETETDLESGNRYEEQEPKPVIDHKQPVVFEEKYLVIMAGQVSPTFLATPISSRLSSFGSCSCRSKSTVSTDFSSGSEEEKQRGSE
ncbi:hypothetical protein R6Q57_008080 [Mikania cordata]